MGKAPTEERQIAELTAEGFEPVLTEKNWYDGPIAGIAMVNGTPHSFIRDPAPGRPEEAFLAWPVSEEMLAIEKELYDIFVQWLIRYNAGEAELDEHPESSGSDPRYNELKAQTPQPGQPQPGAKQLFASWRILDRPHHRAGVGPNYMMRWSDK